jgi:prepilin-type N-terminal cleavage/methylation domain-containing protein
MELIMTKRFTIIELLVVIAIISILLSLLLPSLLKARYHANEAVCASNMAQTCRASYVYSKNNDNVFMDVSKDTYPFYRRYIYRKFLSRYSNYGKLVELGYATPETIYCPFSKEADYKFRLSTYIDDGGEFNPRYGLSNTGKKAVRGSYVFIPYKYSVISSVNKAVSTFQLAMQDKAILLIDSMLSKGEVTHHKYQWSWNVAKADCSVKLQKNISAKSWLMSNSAGSSWTNLTQIRTYFTDKM